MLVINISFSFTNNWKMISNWLQKLTLQRLWIKCVVVSPITQQKQPLRSNNAVSVSTTVFACSRDKENLFTQLKQDFGPISIMVLEWMRYKAAAFCCKHNVFSGIICVVVGDQAWSYIDLVFPPLPSFYLSLFPPPSKTSKSASTYAWMTRSKRLWIQCRLVQIDTTAGMLAMGWMVFFCAVQLMWTFLQCTVL